MSFVDLISTMIVDKMLVEMQKHSKEVLAGAAGPALANAALLLADGCPNKYVANLRVLYQANNLPCPDMEVVFNLNVPKLSNTKSMNQPETIQTRDDDTPMQKTSALIQMSPRGIPLAEEYPTNVTIINDTPMQDVLLSNEIPVTNNIKEYHELQQLNLSAIKCSFNTLVNLEDSGINVSHDLDTSVTLDQDIFTISTKEPIKTTPLMITSTHGTSNTTKPFPKPITEKIPLDIIETLSNPTLDRRSSDPFKSSKENVRDTTSTNSDTSPTRSATTTLGSPFFRSRTELQYMFAEYTRFAFEVQMDMSRELEEITN